VRSATIVATQIVRMKMMDTKKLVEKYSYFDEDDRLVTVWKQ